MVMIVIATFFAFISCKDNNKMSHDTDSEASKGVSTEETNGSDSTGTTPNADASQKTSIA